MSNEDDIARMERVRGGDVGAFAELIRDHQRGLVNFFNRMGAYRDAEDLTQETFLRLYKYREKYRPLAKFTVFLYMLARHVQVDYWRRRRPDLEVLAAEPPEPTDGAASLSPERNLNGHIDIKWALEKLPPKLRMVMIMSVYQNMKYEDIAVALGIPVGTVKSRMFLAIRCLREVLDEK